MNKTHYEYMVESGIFPVKQVFDILDKEIKEDFTFEDFSQTSIASRSLASAQYPLDALMANNQLLFHVYSLYKYDGRIYEIKDSIADMLLNTELDIDVNFLKSPFKEIMLIIPDSLIQVANKDTGLHYVNTCYVNLREISDTHKVLKVLCVGKPNQQSMNIFDDALYYFKIDIENGHVMDSLNATLKKWGDDPRKEIYDRANNDITPRLFQLVLNVLLYITSPEADIRLQLSERKNLEEKIKGLKSTSKIHKAEKKLSRETSLPRFIVGGSISLNKEERGLY